MAEQCRVYEGVELDSRLAELELTAKIVTDAVQAGEAEALQCTDNDPPMARGMTRYFRTVRVLREGAAVLGWTKDNPRNLARTVSPDRDHAIVTALGDENTGRPDMLPSTKYDKGIMVIEAVDANVQLTLFDLPEFAPDGVEQPSSIATWVLLYHIAEDEIRYELSLPVETAGGYISGWRERLIFAPLAREPHAHIGVEEENVAPDIDVVVARR